MIFGEILNSIDVAKDDIGYLNRNNLAMSKGNLNSSLSGLRNICELLQRQFQNNLSKLTVEQETKIESELEYLFIKLKELEEVVNERTN